MGKPVFELLSELVCRNPPIENLRVVHDGTQQDVCDVVSGNSSGVNCHGVGSLGWFCSM